MITNSKTTHILIIQVKSNRQLSWLDSSNRKANTAPQHCCPLYLIKRLFTLPCNSHNSWWHWGSAKSMQSPLRIGTVQAAMMTDFTRPTAVTNCASTATISTCSSVWLRITKSLVHFAQKRAASKKYLQMQYSSWSLVDQIRRGQLRYS